MSCFPPRQATKGKELQADEHAQTHRIRITLSSTNAKAVEKGELYQRSTNIISNESRITLLLTRGSRLTRSPVFMRGTLSALLSIS